MIKRQFDFILSAFVLLLLSPLLLMISFIIKNNSSGPVFYIAERVGRDGKVFNLYKFRTMHVNSDKGNAISAINDSRVFKAGRIIRKLKLDELPQFLNVLMGQMSIVGPRPEVKSIVENFFNQSDIETLKTLPGIASPGSIFNYTHAHKYLKNDDLEQSYVDYLLPIKLGLDKVYLNNNSFIYDIRILFRTFFVITLKICGVKEFKYPPEYKVAKKKIF